MAISEQPGRVESTSPRGRRAKARPTRTRSIRVTLVALLLVPLLALVGLWAFLASITLGNALSERQNNEITESASSSARLALNALDQERLKTFLWLSSPQRPPVSQLNAVRQASDAAVARYQTNAASISAEQGVLPLLRELPGIRQGVDSGTLGAAATFQAYNNIVDGLFDVYASSSESDVGVYRQTLAAIDLGRALEEFTREVTLVAGAEADLGHMSAGEGVLFAKAVGTQTLLAGEATELFNGHMHPMMQSLYNSPLHASVAALEDRIAVAAGGPALPAATLKAWAQDSPAFLGQLLAAANADTKPLAADEAQASNKLFLEAGLAGGLGLLAVIASVILMFRFGRTITRELTGLHDGAEEMASERLPRVVERLRGGDDVDVVAESPPLATGSITEIASVAEAFSSVQRTAVDAAVGQANLRKGVNQVFLNLSLRNQSLLHRQLGMLDTMERAATEPAALADLFRLDHLTTRMRRHAESLIILSGATPGRGWRDPVPVLDVLRAAIAEVEDYVRVDVVSESSDSVAGVAVNDVIHLIAELAENATTYSPPNTRVEIRADAVGTGFAVEIEDRGVGVPAEELADINARLASPPEFDLANSDRLGLFVVGQLAARHQIKVSLRESPFGGTTAIVLLPHAIIVREGESGPFAAVTAGLNARLAINGTPYPPADTGAVTNRERASVFSPTGRHQVDAAEPEVRAQLVARLRMGTPELEAPAGPPALQQTAGRQAPWRDPLRPAPGQEPPQQRFAWNRAEGPQGADAERPGPGQAAQPEGGTHRGLPRRVRQASLAPQLRDRAEPAPPAAEPADEGAGRSPEEMRTMMSALQDGWQRGRSDHLDELDDGEV
jgi:signal transduction histidine kinase